MSAEIKEQLYKKERTIYKASATLKCKMEKIINVETQERHTAVLYFSTLEAHRLVSYKAEEIGAKMFDDIKRQVEGFVENGSAYFLISVDDLTLKFASYQKPLGGCETESLPLNSIGINESLT